MVRMTESISKRKKNPYPNIKDIPVLLFLILPLETSQESAACAKRSGRTWAGTGAMVAKPY